MSNQSFNFATIIVFNNNKFFTLVNKLSINNFKNLRYNYINK